MELEIENRFSAKWIVFSFRERELISMPAPHVLVMEIDSTASFVQRFARFTHLAAIPPNNCPLLPIMYAFFTIHSHTAVSQHSQLSTCLIYGLLLYIKV